MDHLLFHFAMAHKWWCFVQSMFGWAEKGRETERETGNSRAHKFFCARRKCVRGRARIYIYFYSDFTLLLLKKKKNG